MPLMTPMRANIAWGLVNFWRMNGSMGMGRAQQSATRNGRAIGLPHSETEFNGIGGLLTYIGDGPCLSK